MSLGMQLNKVLQRVGLKLSRFPSPADRRRIRLMQAYAVDVVIDIGANVGQYGKLLRRLGYRGRIISFEPLPDAFETLSSVAAADSHWKATQKVVSDKSGQLTMQVSENSVSSSVMELTPTCIHAAPASRVVGSVTVDCIPLDSVLGELRGRRVMVKIDTQGHEHSVLLSGGSLIKSALLIEIEMSFVELYRGQKLFWDLDADLVAKGFRLTSLEEGFFDERSGELLQCDAIYRNVQATNKIPQTSSTAL